MNFRVFFKSVKFAFRARVRVLAFILIYAILYINVAKGLTNNPNDLSYIGLAFIVSTIYAILVSQFRRRDISIFKCIGWDNSNVMLLVMGEVVLVSLAAFLVVFQVSVEILGLTTYFLGTGTNVTGLWSYLYVDLISMFVTLFWIILAQLPGLALSMWRATQVPPMRALREE